ncbi:MAG: hypothetical protein HY965_09320 [Ignavibacteriales bacterium]|nr:hypothetical protein [Ignavibacteriales bacterium]
MENTALVKKWIDTLPSTSSELKAIKAIEMQDENYLFNALTSLTEVFNYAIATAKPSTTSGLVEMQKYFAILRNQLEK